MARAKKEDLSDKVTGFKDPKEFVASIQKPRRVMFLVKAGPTVDKVIDLLSEHMEQGDILIDGGNEWYENSVRRSKALESKGIDYVAMGVSGGERVQERSFLMPGCSKRRTIFARMSLRQLQPRWTARTCGVRIFFLDQKITVTRQLELNQQILGIDRIRNYVKWFTTVSNTVTCN